MLTKKKSYIFENIYKNVCENENGAILMLHSRTFWGSPDISMTLIQHYFQRLKPLIAIFNNHKEKKNSLCSKKINISLWCHLLSSSIVLAKWQLNYDNLTYWYFQRSENLMISCLLLKIYSFEKNNTIIAWFFDFGGYNWCQCYVRELIVGNIISENLTDYLNLLTCFNNTTNQKLKNKFSGFSQVLFQ